ncbi:MAG: hypothetical protein ACT4OY_03385 [Alphaproteobacteria bacterium]
MLDKTVISTDELCEKLKEKVLSKGKRIDYTSESYNNGLAANGAYPDFGDDCKEVFELTLKGGLTLIFAKKSGSNNCRSYDSSYASESIQVNEGEKVVATASHSLYSHTKYFTGRYETYAGEKSEGRQPWKVSSGELPAELVTQLGL